MASEMIPVDPLENLSSFVVPSVEPINLPITSVVVETRPEMMERIRKIVEWHRRWFRFVKEVVVSCSDPKIPGTVFVGCERQDAMSWNHYYSRMCIGWLNTLCDDGFVLLWQWDGFIVNPSLWTNEFLKWDYIGHPVGESWHLYANEVEKKNPNWKSPIKPGDWTVGNGGFSLRSKKFLKASASLDIPSSLKYEDAYLCVEKRKELEDAGIKMAPLDAASLFVKGEDRRVRLSDCFGFHGYRDNTGCDNLGEAKEWLEKCWKRKTSTGIRECCIVTAYTPEGQWKELGVYYAPFWGLTRYSDPYGLMVGYYLKF